MSELKRVGIRSFTLVELLIVIAILAVLAAAVVLVLNPAELLAQARDSQRISDVNMVKKAVDLFIVDNSTTSLGTANRVYISLPDSSTSCANITGLPTLPATWQYVCAPTASLRNINGTGWLPLDLSQVKGGSPIPYLPIDPQNDPSLTRYYQYIPGTNTFELTALMESEKQAKAAAKDGGTDAGRLEVGSSLGAWKEASMIGYDWPLNEGSGTLVSDSLGSGNNGTATGALWSNDARRGWVIDFPTTGQVVLPTAAFASASEDFAISYWFKTRRSSDYGVFNNAVNYNLGRIGHRSANVIGIWNPDVNIDLSESFVTNSWEFITYVRSGGSSGSILVYRNGKLVGTGTHSPAQSFDKIGGKSDNSSWSGYDGLVSQLKFYRRTLTANEIRAIYNATK